MSKYLHCGKSLPSFALALIYRRKGQIGLSDHVYGKVLQLAELDRAQHRVAATLELFALVDETDGRLDLAKNMKLCANADILLAKVYLALQDYDKSRLYSDKALAELPDSEKLMSKKASEDLRRYCLLVAEMIKKQAAEEE